MSRAHASRLFDSYYDNIVHEEPVEDTASEVFQSIFVLTQDKEEIKGTINQLHDFLCESNQDSISEIVYDHNVLDENHLKEINRLKRCMRHSQAVGRHLTENLEFFVGMQSSDGDMIDFIRSVL